MGLGRLESSSTGEQLMDHGGVEYMGLNGGGAQGRELKMRSGEPVSTMDKNNDRAREALRIWA